MFERHFGQLCSRGGIGRLLGVIVGDVGLGEEVGVGRPLVRVQHVSQVGLQLTQLHNNSNHIECHCACQFDNMNFFGYVRDIG